MRGRLENLSGLQFGRLVVMDSWRRDRNRTLWMCLCACGNISEVWAASLKGGVTKSCGCLRIESLLLRKPWRVKHGMWKTSEFRTWMSMIQRCENPTHRAFKNYGGRGITVCTRWKDFLSFYLDMGPRPRGMTLERKDNDGGYSLENCCWATQAQQNRNQRRNIYIEAFGRRLVVKDWAKTLGIPHSSLQYSLSIGLSIEQIAARRGCIVAS